MAKSDYKPSLSQILGEDNYDLKIRVPLEDLRKVPWTGPDSPYKEKGRLNKALGQIGKEEHEYKGSDAAFKEEMQHRAGGNDPAKYFKKQFEEPCVLMYANYDGSLIYLDSGSALLEFKVLKNTLIKGDRCLLEVDFVKATSTMSEHPGCFIGIREGVIKELGIYQVGRPFKVETVLESEIYSKAAKEQEQARIKEQKEREKLRKDIESSV